jgi:membrane-bound metal-dependent hydrolase YbcI (DUF457 family)
MMTFASRSERAKIARSVLMGCGDLCYRRVPMPSPLGHALAGLTVGWLARCRVGRRAGCASGAIVVACAALAIAPDLDLLWGRHRDATHSIGAAVLVAVAAWLLLRAAGVRSIPTAALLGVAYATHILLDWLGADKGLPLGVPALWPLTDRSFQSGATLFLNVERRYWMADFWPALVKTLSREVFILGPIALGVWIVCVRNGSRRKGS